MFTQHFAQRTRQQRRMCSSHRLAIRLFYFCFSRENFVCATFSMATTTVLAVGERVAYTCRTTYVSCSIACCSTRCVCMSVAFHSGHFRSCCMCACARPQMLALRFQFCSVPFVVQSSTMSTHLLPKATTLTSWAITSIRFLFAQTISRWLLFCWPTHSFRPLNSYLLFRFFLHPQRIETHSNSETRESTFTSFAVFRFVSLRACVCVLEHAVRFKLLCVKSWNAQYPEVGLCETECEWRTKWEIYFIDYPKTNMEKVFTQKLLFSGERFQMPTDTAWYMAEKKIRARINDNRPIYDCSSRFVSIPF